MSHVFCIDCGARQSHRVCADCFQKKVEEEQAEIIMNYSKATPGRICGDHRPVQHRDGKPPWCPNCGFTASMSDPVSNIIGLR